MHPTLLEVYQKGAHEEFLLKAILVYLLETTAVGARGGAVDPDVTKREVMDYSVPPNSKVQPALNIFESLPHLYQYS